MASDERENLVVLRPVRFRRHIHRRPVFRASFPFRIPFGLFGVLWHSDRPVGGPEGRIVVPEEHVIPPFEHQPPRPVKIEPPIYIACNNKLRKWAHRHAYLFWFNMVFFIPTWIYLIVDRYTR